MYEKNITQVPTDIPVQLLRIFHGKTGNVYMPGIYQPGTLPTTAYNNYYVTPVVAVVTENLTAASDTAEIKNGSFKVEDVIKRENNTPGVTEEVSINKQLRPEDKHIKAKIEKPLVLPPLDINNATHEELVALNGVGKATADKIISLREESGFIDYEDLDGRVPLPLGRDWTAFNISFE